MSKLVLFQTIQIRVSVQFRYQKYFYFKQFSLAKVHSLSIKNTIVSDNSV